MFDSRMLALVTGAWLVFTPGCKDKARDDHAGHADAAAAGAVDPHAHHAAAPDAGPDPLAYDVAETVRRTENEIAFHGKKIDAKPDKYTVAYDRLISLHSQLARLTGTWAPYEKALALDKKAFALVGDKGGPLAHRASLYATLHKNKAAEEALDGYLARGHLKDDERAKGLAARADLKLQRGDMTGAEADLSKALALDKNATVLARASHFEAERGHLEEARQYLDQALALPQAPRGVGYAWLWLQRGIVELDTGHLTEADKMFARADRALPGWYLVAEHRAELLAEQGKTDEAIARYRTIIAETNNPEFMDALADQLDKKGQEAEAKTWRDKATARYEAWLKQFPEAAWGHAIEHFAHTDPARAVRLARQDRDNRPGGRSHTVLAERLMAEGALDDAAAALDAVPAGYASLAFHEVAQKVRTALGDETRAAEHAAAIQRLTR